MKMILAICKVLKVLSYLRAQMQGTDRKVPHHLHFTDVLPQ